MSSWASQAHAFSQPVCEALSWLHHWSVPHVHTSGAFSPSEWGQDPQCQATQVVHWTWWWQRLVAWHCRSVWSLPCHSTADTGGLVLSMAKSHTALDMTPLGWLGRKTSTQTNNGQVSLAWSIALRTQELYTQPRVLKERWCEERTSSSSLNFFQAVFTCVVVESSQPPAAESIS